MQEQLQLVILNSLVTNYIATFGTYYHVALGPCML